MDLVFCFLGCVVNLLLLLLLLFFFFQKVAHATCILYSMDAVKFENALKRLKDYS